MRTLHVLLLAVVILGSYSCKAIKTKEDIYGVWLLNTTRINGELQFDRNDPGVIAARLTELVEELQGHVPEDEKAALAKKALDWQAMNSRTAYRFTADSVFMMNEESGHYVSGTYAFDKNEQEVVCMMDYSSMYSQRYIQKTVFRIIGGRLITHRESKDKRETTIQEYIKKED